MSDGIKNILDDREKFSFAAAVFLLSVFAFFLLIKHDLGAFFRMDRVIKEARENLDTLENMSGYKDYINQFDSRFVRAGNANRLMEILTELAGKKNVTLGSIKPVDSYSASGYRIIRVTAEGAASYPDILALVSDIEGYNRYICVEALNVSADRGSGNFSDPFTGRGLMPPQTRGEQYAPRGTKFTLTIASLVRET